MPTALRQIAEATRAASDHASSLLLAARLDGVSRADHDALADFADEQRDRWHRAVECAWRADDCRPDPHQVLVALDYDADEYGGTDDYGSADYDPDDYGPYPDAPSDKECW